jgi:hypothetical protein
MSEHIRMLTTQEREAVTGGWAMSWVALNPQPIPPGHIAGLLYTPGCPGPIVLPPSPC